MAVQDFSAVSDLLHFFNGELATYVADISSNAIIAITPLVSICFVISILFYSLLVMRGAIDTPISDLLGKIIKYSIIVVLALEVGIYQKQIAQVLVNMPDGLAEELLPKAVSNEAYSNNAGLGAILDRTMAEGIGLSSEAWEKASVYDSDTWVFGFLGVGVFFATVAVVAIGMTLIIVSQMFLAIAVGLGPIFIVAFAFDATKSFFDRWLSTIFSLIFIVVTYSMISGLLMWMLGGYIKLVELDSTVNVLYTTGGLWLMLISFPIAYLLIPLFANSITGGAIGGALTPVRRVMNGHKDAAKGGINAGVSAAKGVNAAVGTTVMAAQVGGFVAGQTGRALKGYAMGSKRGR